MADFIYNRCKLIKAIDGDTIDFRVDLGFHISKEIRVQLLDVNAPELRTDDLVEKEKGAKCKAFVEKKLEQATSLRLVTFKDKKGKYGRYLANVWLHDDDQMSLNDHLKVYIKSLEG